MSDCAIITLIIDNYFEVI